MTVIEKQVLTKEEKFKKYANLRLKSALKSIRLLGNLSNENNYEYTEEQSKTINNELNKAVLETKKKFEKSKSGKKKDDDFF